MIEFFYILLLLFFGALIVFAATRYLIHANAVQGELCQYRERRQQQETRLASMREEADLVDVDVQLLEMRLEALRNQESCMRNLEQFDSGSDLHTSAADRSADG